MPQSSRTRSKPKNVNKPDRMKEVIQKALSLDRRRQAQIENQKRSINRLLERFDEGKYAGTSHAVYTEEMNILHMAAAQFRVENDDLRAVLRDLVTALDALPLDMMSTRGTNLPEIVAAARALITVSAPVSESGGEAG